MGRHANLDLLLDTGPNDEHRVYDKIFERKIVNILLSISFNISLGCSKEPSHRDGSFEYSQHMFCLRNKNFFFLYALLTKGLSVVQFYLIGI